MRVGHLLPPEARVIAPLAELDFLDSQTVTISEPMTAAEAWRRLMAPPLPGLGLAFRLCDDVSTWFGVARLGAPAALPIGPVQVGDRLNFSLVEEVSGSTLAPTAHDRHLDVMA